MIQKNLDLFDSTGELDANISSDGNYRYFLRRQIQAKGPKITFICLNPSIADAVKDDSTVRRCKGFVKSWGGSVLYMINLFAYRSTSPQKLLTVSDPIGIENNFWIDKIINESDVCIAAWGNHGKFLNRDSYIINIYLKKLYYLELSIQGNPKHPLYLKSNLKPKRFN